MPLFRSSFLRCAVLPLAMFSAACAVAHASDPFMKPTKEELSMTEVPGYPGAAAMVLYREQITKDDMRVTQRYERIKILTEKGKDLANVELAYVSASGFVDMGKDQFGNDMSGEGDNKAITDIVGRTIHPDGTIIPFTGKPYLKTIEKQGGLKYQARVFTLPEVEVGSIIEYRYSTRIDDNMVESPDWYIQGPLYVKSAHYVWYPTTRELVGRSGAPINTITWFPVLPAGAKVEHRDLPASAPGGGQASIYELKVKDIPPVPQEEFQPPTKSLTYRVMFNFSEYHSSADFWKSEGKDMFRKIDSFANVNSDLRAATEQVTAGATTPEEKLRKIYAATQAIENTDYTRAHARAEDKAAGLGKVSNAGDVLEHKRGSSQQIAELFLGMARAAGFKTYAMWVPDRSYHLFVPQWLNTYAQFDALLTIVMVDGKEVYFDPGERYCQFGHLAWQHTDVNGIREVDGGTALAQTPDEPYTTNKTTRVGNLTMDENGVVSGKLVMTYYGAGALAWRQRALRGDEQSIRRSLRVAMERMLPRSLQVKTSSVDGLTDYEKPLVVTYEVKGTIGAATGKRLVVPSDLFTSNEMAMFPHEKREQPVYFHYSQTVIDAQRIVLPPTMSVEATPDAGNAMFLKRAEYKLSVEGTPKWVTTRRTFIFGDVLVLQSEYPELRKFYATLQAKDKDPVVLKADSTISLPEAGAKDEKAKPDADDGGSDDDDDDSSGGL